MSLSLVLKADGSWKTCVVDHRAVSSMLGGPITFVGGIPSLNVFAVALQQPPDDVNHKCCTDDFMDLPVKGPVAFIATDSEGQPMHVDVEGLLRHLNLSSTDDAFPRN